MKIVQARFLCGVLVVLSSLLLFACGDGGSSGEAAPGAADMTVSASNTGSVSVSLTDNDQGYNAVVLTIVEVGIVASHNETTYYNSTELDGEPINVLDFPGETTQYLGDIEVELPENGDPVCFNQIRLVLAKNDEMYKFTGKNKDVECGDSVPCNNYVIENDDPTKYPLKTPSAHTSGLKIVPKSFCKEDDPDDFCVETPNDFCVEDGDDTVYVSLDFDPNKAIKRKGNGEFQLKPTGIRIVEGEWFDSSDNGFIDGHVAVPIYNVGVCSDDEYDPAPLVTVAAYNSAELGSPVKVQTTTFANDGPAVNTKACEDWCFDEPDGLSYNSCRLDCEEDVCFYSGEFKLIVPEKRDYDLTATWEDLSGEDFSDELKKVEYNSTVLMVLDSD